MRSKVTRIVESLLIVGLFIPSGVLLANQTHEEQSARLSRAEWNDSAQASNLFNQMDTLSYKVRREVERLHVQGQQLDWQYQAQRLAATRLNVNEIGNDLARLDQDRSEIAPWQKTLVNNATLPVHDMAYRMDAAINGLDTHKNRLILLVTKYSRDIKAICKNANQLADTIGRVTQSAPAEHKVGVRVRPTTTDRS